jgi:lipoprotein-releasing system permease protein
MTSEDLTEAAVAERRRAWMEIGVGLGLVLVGLVVVYVTTHGGYVSWAMTAACSGGGLVLAVHGVWRLASYRMFVAWRYLLNHPRRVNPLAGMGLILLFLSWGYFLNMTGNLEGTVAFFKGAQFDARSTATSVITLVLLAAMIGYLLRHSKPALYTFIGGVVLSALMEVAIRFLITPPHNPFEEAIYHAPLWVIWTVLITKVAAGVVAGLALFFGSLRAIYTFFTTVPLGGVWIGTSALVCVLSVMSGFETDLREKILGSNAHIQITREEGDFVDWRAAKAKIDKIPGVVASTPYAVSEVVIAANNNGMPVLIKGIDPASVGKVTDLISDLEDPEAMQRLAPLVEDPHDRSVPQAPKPSGSVLDPPPDDMPNGGDPIDFSPPADADVRPDDDTLGSKHKDTFGGDAKDILDDVGKVSDPPPADMLTTDAPPVDYSDPDAPDVHVVDVPLEPALSRRTQALPGILVGRELVKQTHLYTGEEVRVVSPLSDPSNPDATGTPIPFNRDYRVAGVFFTGMYEYDLKYVYVTLDSLQDFLDRGDAVDGIEVRITDPDSTGAYVQTDDGPGKIREVLGPGYRVVDWRELNHSLFSALKLEKVAMFLVLGIVILVASFSIVGNLIMVVVEKGREIALLKTLGASDAGVMQLFAIQGLLIGVIGTLLGLVTGLVACWAGKKFGLPLNPDVYYIDRLPIHVDPQSVIAAAAAGVVISIAATFYPAMLAARVRPATGLRH